MAHSTGAMDSYVPASPDYSVHELDIHAETEAETELGAEESQQPPADFDEQDGPAAAAAQPAAAAVGGVQVDQRTVQQLAADHQVALTNEASAKTASADAVEAKKTADEKKKRAYEARGAGFASPALTAAWKAAVREAKQAGVACKTAKDAASRATAAKKTAWAALEAARKDEARNETQAHHAAAAGFERRRNTLISAPRQATEGLKPWAGCPGVTNVRLVSAKLPALDGHEETDVDGHTVPFAPLLGGSTVLVAQTGGMKTVRTLGFLQEPVVPELEARVEWHCDAPIRTFPDGSSGHINADLPFVFVTARINLAHKLEADLAKRDLHLHNYKNKPNDVTMEAWIKHPWVIISIEQLEKLEPWLSMYKDGIVIFDEFVTGASSLVNGVTVHRPKATLRTLRKLVDASSYFIAMDADFDADGKGKALLKGVAKKKRVLHVQTTLPSLKTTIVYGYAGIKELNVAYEERLELSCLTSAEDRRNGTAPEGNRTYVGEDWPSDVNTRCEQLREWRVPVKGLHGKMGGAVRKGALKDLDAFVEDADAFVVSSVAGIGTDQDCKYSAGFLRLKSGDHAPGPRSAAQKAGRLNRNSDNTLDPVTAPDGTVYAGGAVYVLLPGLPPSLDSDGGSNQDPSDRAANKLKAMRGQVDERRSAVTSTHSDAEQHFDRNNGTYMQQSGGEYTKLPGGAPSPIASSDDAATLAELEALDNVENDDKQPHSYAIRCFEYMALPRFSGLALIQPLSESERAELTRLRGGQTGDAHVLTEDEAVGEMTTRELHAFVKERVEADNHLGQGSPFWTDCYGMCVTGMARHEGSNIDEAYMAVWGALKDYKIFPDEADAFVDLFNDGNDNGVLHRGMMRFLSMEELLQSEMRGLKLQVLSDPTAGGPRPLYKLSWLKECARLLRLDLADLLEPRVFTSSKHAWVAAHNRLIGDGAASLEDETMAKAVRVVAIKLGCKGIRHGERVKKPTSLLATVHAVLAQRCAMHPPGFKKNTARSPVHSWEVKELAPGCAELALHWHDGLKQKVPLGEYCSRDTAWKAHKAEEERERRARRASAATDAMLDQFGEDEGAEEVIDTDALMPTAPCIAPFDPNVLFVHYEEAALQECVRAFGADEPRRKAAADALFDLIAKRAAVLPGIGDDDAELVKMRELKKAINRLATRHRIATELDTSLPAAATEGPLEGARIAREGYAYLADGEGRRYAKGERWRDDDGEWRSATAQGMPGDLRTKLLGWKLSDKDGRKSDLVIYVIVAHLLCLQRSSVNVLIDEYLLTDELCKAWHDGVAAHHGINPEAVKRWPNILGNGGTYETCLKGAGLPLDSPRDARVERMGAQMKKLRPAIAKASRDNPNALWPGSEQFFNRHDARLQRAMPHLQPHARFSKVFSYLINTAEDRILAIHAQAQRAVRRDAIGPLEFDALPPEVRDTGVMSFDGLATERAGDDPEAGDRAAEAALVNAGWHAQSWGIAYKIVEKPMFGEQHVDPNEFESAKGARRALQEAAAAYPEVQQAVDNPAMYRRRALPVAGGNASVIPVSNGRALLTIEVRKREQKYGLFGGKAEPGETLAQTAAREAFEESGRTLSDASRHIISQLEPAAFKECRMAEMHVAVAPVGTEDAAAPARFIEANANRAGSTTKHVDIEWVDIAKLLDHRWRKDNVHHHQALMIAAVRATLREHVVSATAVSGEKRARGAELDMDDELAAAMADEVEAAMAEAEAQA